MNYPPYVETGMPFVRNISQAKQNDEMEIVHYRDAIKTVDVSPLLRLFGFASQRNHNFLWIVKDICGIICAILTWSLIIFAEYVMWSRVLLPSKDLGHSFVNGVVFQALTCLAAVSHLRAMFSDPGAVPRGNATKEHIAKLELKEGQIVYRCPKCISIKPNRAHHCRVCRRCVRKMDHHCPWINNCVGENNQKFFILFTMYICIISVHAFYLTVRHFFICSGTDWKGCEDETPILSTILLVFLLFESVLFSIFTGIMFSSQVWAVWSDTTGIENVKREYHLWQRVSGWQSVKSVFGYQFSYRWFSPFHSTCTVFVAMEIYDYSV